MGTPTNSINGITFGREGGNIMPFAVMISSDGHITREGSGAPGNAQSLSPLTVRGLEKLADAEGFWEMPDIDDGLPDIAFQFVAIRLPDKHHKVSVRGGPADGPFRELYALLTEIV